MSRERVLSLLRAHGDATTSFQVLEPGLSYAFDPEIEEACVAYVDTGSAWVAAGPPIAARAHRAEVARRFLAAAARAGRRACFFAVDRELARDAGLAALPIGEDPIWRLEGWDAVVRAHRGLREQLRRARAKRVRARVVDPGELAEGHPTRRAMERIIVRWLASRPLAAMGFLVDVRPFELAEERIVVVAERDATVVAFAAAVPVYARNAVLLEDLLRDGAPNGTAELLVDAVFREARARGATHATLGLAPLSGAVPPALATLRRLSRRLYNFDGVHAFKARMHPGAWEPVFLAHPSRVLWPLAIWDALGAFATGGLLRFGVASLRRQRRAVALVLGALLLPWALALSLPPEARWFPSRGVQLAWAVFDLFLATALLALFRRWRSAVATVLAAVTALDAALTLVQIAAWDAPRVHGPAAALLLVVAVAAPSIASVFLFWARDLDLDPI